MIPENQRFDYTKQMIINKKDVETLFLNLRDDEPDDNFALAEVIHYVSEDFDIDFNDYLSCEMTEYVTKFCFINDYYNRYLRIEKRDLAHFSQFID